MHGVTPRFNDDFRGYCPTYAEMIALTREVATAKAEALGLAPYDAMLDGFDPGMRRDYIEPIFDDVREWLPPLVGEIIERQKSCPHLPLSADIPHVKQDALGRELMEALGYDLTRGRIDTSSHPFTGGVPGDVRITTRYGEKFTESLYGVLHETGHALYEQGLPSEWRGLPVGQARGMTLHESQSLFVEMQLASSPAFLHYLSGKIRDHFGVSGPAWEEKNLARALSRVERSTIRTSADEATYPLHILLRYELEQALLSGDLKVADLPIAWNEKMEKYLGITPPNDREGCLQDTHWPEGWIGYFPTYSLGAMTAAQLMAAARKDLPDMDSDLANGNLAPVMDWVKHNIHAQGSLHTTQELIENATGKPLDPGVFKKHLTERYLPSLHQPPFPATESRLRS